MLIFSSYLLCSNEIINQVNNILNIFFFFLCLLVFVFSIYKRMTNIMNGIFAVLILALLTFLHVAKIIVVLKYFYIFLLLVLFFVPGKKTDSIVSNKLFYCSIFLFVILFLNSRLGFYNSIIGAGMRPTMQPNDRIVSNIFEKDYKRGDIVKYEFNGKIQVSRIVGLEGEIVNIKGNDVYINSNLLDESYAYKFGKPLVCNNDMHCNIKVSKDSYFVLGDNRGNNLGSPFHGLISKKQLKGKVLKIIYPLRHRKGLY